MKHRDAFYIYRNLIRQRHHLWRLHSLHVGLEHVGVAVSDIDTGQAYPISVVEKKESNIMALNFRHLIENLSVEGIMVGSPPRKTKNSIATHVELFVNDLSKTGKLEEVQYTLWYDDFTALKNVECLLDPFSLHPTVAKTIREEVLARSATDILQSYLDEAKILGL